MARLKGRLVTIIIRSREAAEIQSRARGSWYCVRGGRVLPRRIGESSRMSTLRCSIISLSSTTWENPQRACVSDLQTLLTVGASSSRVTRSPTAISGARSDPATRRQNMLL